MRLILCLLILLVSGCKGGTPPKQITIIEIGSGEVRCSVQGYVLAQGATTLRYADAKGVHVVQIKPGERVIVEDAR